MDIGGRQLHLNCSGRGTPIVVVETGFGDGAKRRPIPPPIIDTTPTPRPRSAEPSGPGPLDLPTIAWRGPSRRCTHGRRRNLRWRPPRTASGEWPSEYYARWAAAPQQGSLGTMPLMVLTRAEGGDGDDLDKPVGELERIRLASQQSLAQLSSAGTQRIVKSGHNMHIEATATVIAAAREIVEAAGAAGERQVGRVQRGICST